MGKVVVESCSWRAVVVTIWIVAIAAVVGVYRLGFLRGEIAEMESRGRADLCVGRGRDRARPSRVNVEVLKMPLDPVGEIRVVR